MIQSERNPKQNAAYGAILGALVGDASGAVLEFLGRQPSVSDVSAAMDMPGGGVFDVAPGQFTDDGEMTVTLLRALATSDGSYDINLVAKAYGEWADSHPFDIGGATSHALRYLHGPDFSGLANERACESNAQSKANGSLMRATPLGLAGAFTSEAQTIVWADQDCALTHPHKSCQAAVTTYALAIRHLIVKPRDIKGALTSATRYLETKEGEVIGWLEDAILGDLPAGEPMIGFVRIGFTHAFHHLVRETPYRMAIAQTLMLGGDTDTNACIVGGLVGAAQGVQSIPASMLESVLQCDTQLGQPRPSIFGIQQAFDSLQTLTKKLTHEI